MQESTAICVAVLSSASLQAIRTRHKQVLSWRCQKFVAQSYSSEHWLGLKKSYSRFLKYPKSNKVKRSTLGILQRPFSLRTFRKICKFDLLCCRHNFRQRKKTKQRLSEGEQPLKLINATVYKDYDFVVLNLNKDKPGPLLFLECSLKNLNAEKFGP